MYKMKKAILQMEQPLLKDMLFDEKTYDCIVHHTKLSEEEIYFLVHEDEISDYSLDATYKCTIQLEDHKILSTGIIRERYIEKEGSMVVYQVKNGFYKSNIK